MDERKSVGFELKVTNKRTNFCASSQVKVSEVNVTSQLFPTDFLKFFLKVLRTNAFLALKKSYWLP